MAFGELFRHWTYRVFAPGALLRRKYEAFRELIALDGQCLERIATIEDIHYGSTRVDWTRVVAECEKLERDVLAMVALLREMNPLRWIDLSEYAAKIAFYARMAVSVPEPDLKPPYILPLDAVAGRPGIAGAKAARLATIRQKTALSVPDGVVITASAYHYVIEYNGLRRRLDELLREIDLADGQRLVELCSAMRLLVLQAELPPQLEADLLEAGMTLAPRRTPLIVRSSAIAEDGDASFAGQYSSMADVQPADVPDAYLEVIASKYTPRAVAYRIAHGLADSETPMAVLLMPQVDAVASGVIYSKAPSPPLHIVSAAGDCGVLSIHAISGSGSPIMDGKRTASTAWLSRTARHRILERTKDLPIAMDDLKLLARHSRELEQLFGEPQDVEWTIDSNGRIDIVQTRPVPGAATVPPPPQDLSAMTALLEGADGIVPGTACGTVRHALSCADIRELPPGTVLVTSCLGPALARVLDRLEAVVSLEGSRASHFASVAREAGIPVLVTDQPLFDLLPPETAATVDAHTGKVFLGCPIEQPASRSSPRALARRGTMNRLARAMPHIARLNLRDPASSDFAPPNCRSLHDIVRFCHEMAVSEMFGLVSQDGRGLGGARKVRGDIPVIMYVLNLDDGLFPSAAGKNEISPEDFKSLPLWAMWFGLSSEPEAWRNMPPPADWNELDRISGGIFRRDAPQLASYAVASEIYAHLMLRFGYHFAVVDTLCGPDSRANYIQFRLKGGGASAEGGSLRLLFLTQVLERSGFSTKCVGDLIDARHGAASESVIQKRLALLGRLLVTTRLMDMRLTSEEQVQDEVEHFFRQLAPAENSQ